MSKADEMSASETPRYDKLQAGIKARRELRGFNVPEDLSDALDILHQTERALTAAKAELAEKAVDAARYRWLRSRTGVGNPFEPYARRLIKHPVLGECSEYLWRDDLDAAIDAALAQGGDW